MLKLMKKDKLILLKKEKNRRLTHGTKSKPSIFFKEKIKIRDGLSMITTNEHVFLSELYSSIS
jgi:hypothetical protein